MPTTPATGTTTPSVEEQFLDLVYGDTDLLAAEFDAIIAAEWPEPPADEHGPSVPDRQPDGGPGRRRGGPVSRLRHPGLGGWARERSPPFRHPTSDA
jgi:hypothetical protein